MPHIFLNSLISYVNTRSDRNPVSCRRKSVALSPFIFSGLTNSCRERASAIRITQDLNTCPVAPTEMRVEVKKQRDHNGFLFFSGDELDDQYHSRLGKNMMMIIVLFHVSYRMCTADDPFVIFFFVVEQPHLETQPRHERRRSWLSSSWASIVISRDLFNIHIKTVLYGMEGVC